MNNTITHKLLNEKSLSYEDYIKLTEEIVAGKSEDEIYKNEKMLNYTKDNLARMNNITSTLNIDKRLYNELQQMQEKQIWVCITESWCGDASQIVPALYLVASCSANIEFRILLRDSNDDVMNNYLTNGSKSIPKLIILKPENLQEIETWGPRPAVVQKIVQEQKDDTSTSFGDKVRMIHSWYNENQSKDLQEEFITIVKAWKTNTNA
jgi:hypothetical protein